MLIADTSIAAKASGSQSLALADCCCGCTGSSSRPADERREASAYLVPSPSCLSAHLGEPNLTTDPIMIAPSTTANFIPNETAGNLQSKINPAYDAPLRLAVAFVGAEGCVIYNTGTADYLAKTSILAFVDHMVAACRCKCLIKGHLECRLHQIPLENGRFSYSSHFNEVNRLSVGRSSMPAVLKRASGIALCYTPTHGCTIEDFRLFTSPQIVSYGLCEHVAIRERTAFLCRRKKQSNIMKRNDKKDGCYHVTIAIADRKITIPTHRQDNLGSILKGSLLTYKLGAAMAPYLPVKPAKDLPQAESLKAVVERVFSFDALLLKDVTELFIKPLGARGALPINRIDVRDWALLVFRLEHGFPQVDKEYIRLVTIVLIREGLPADCLRPVVDRIAALTRPNPINN